MFGYFIPYQFPKVILKLNKEQMSNDFRQRPWACLHYRFGFLFPLSFVFKELCYVINAIGRQATQFHCFLYGTMR